MLWLMGSAGGLWWLWAWGLWMGFNLLLMVVYPVFIAPLFNKFEPLADASLTARVTALMQRCGFQAKGLFVMDGSRAAPTPTPTSPGWAAPNAWCFSTPCSSSSRPPRWKPYWRTSWGTSTTAHRQRMVMPVCLSLAGFALLGWLSAQPWFYAGLGVRPSLGLLVPGAPSAPHDALALLLFMLVVPVFTVFLSPLFAQLSRRHEFEADAYAMAQASGADLASALLKLYEDNASTLTPDPLFVKFYYSHPPASRAAGAHALPHYRMTSMLKQKDWSTQARRALTAPELVAKLAQMDGWQLHGDGADVAITKTFRFDDYHETMAFVNAVAFIAHTQDHHPDLSVHYNRCVVRFNTHDVGGISDTDIDCAQRVDALLTA
jgi:pterin-4a-carbinolamine dehydratase